MTSNSYDQILKNVTVFADTCRPDRIARQQRRNLDAADFRALADAGMTLTGIPASMGGLWQDPARSTPEYATLFRTIARGDPSVALVACMHPAVLIFWCLPNAVPATFADTWSQQQARLFEHAKTGHWFGTIASEPGSGGDLLFSRTVAEPAGNGEFRLTGDKHMGSGSGVTSFMITTAKAAGDDVPDLYVLDTRDQAWDGSQGMTLVRSWDGLGMKATQSHAFRLEAMPAERFAWTNNAIALAPQALATIQCMFMAVAMGILDSALAEARQRLRPKAAKGRMSAYEQVEWSNAENEIWLANQAFDGILRAVSAQQSPIKAAAEGKVAIATLAERALERLGRVIGGASYAESQPFGQWALDIRALGFLRPPWALAHHNLFEQSWSDDDVPLSENQTAADPQ